MNGQNLFYFREKKKNFVIVRQANFAPLSSNVFLRLFIIFLVTLLDIHFQFSSSRSHISNAYWAFNNLRQKDIRLMYVLNVNRDYPDYFFQHITYFLQFWVRLIIWIICKRCNQMIIVKSNIEKLRGVEYKCDKACT